MWEHRWPEVRWYRASCEVPGVSGSCNFTTLDVLFKSEALMGLALYFGDQNQRFIVRGLRF